MNPFLIGDLSHLIITSRGVITVLRQSIGSDPIRRADEAKPATESNGEARGKGHALGISEAAFQAGHAGRCFRPLGVGNDVDCKLQKRDAVPLRADKTFSLRTIFIIISA